MERQPEELQFIADFSGQGNPNVALIHANDTIINLSDGGVYKQMYGVPVKLYGEDPENPVYEAYSIEGIFDAKNTMWRSASARVKDLQSLEEKVISANGWPFSLREGDGLFQGGRRIYPLR